jgi:hypothetical protein
MDRAPYSLCMVNTFPVGELSARSWPDKVIENTYSSHEGFSCECELPVESGKYLFFQAGTFYLDMEYYIV